MTYSLLQLTLDSFGLLLNDELIGDVVRCGSGDVVLWKVELLDGLPESKRPPPSDLLERGFTTLDDVSAWLGNADVKSRP
jgi:hypothetical protein